MTKKAHTVQRYLIVKNLRATIDGKQVLKGVSLKVASGEVHAIMGPNGSGKSSFAHSLMGSPAYEISQADTQIVIGDTQIQNLPPHERAKAGLFLAFQSPIAIPGVSVMNILRTAYQELHPGTEPQQVHAPQNPVLARRWKGSMSMTEFIALVKKYASFLSIPEGFLSRGIHDGFSGGEKKKIEMLQALVLAPKFAIFDEIDTGLDVDALAVVAKGITELAANGTGVIVITHYQRILSYLSPEYIHVLVDGKIAETQKGSDLARKIEQKGYAKYVTE